MISSKKQKKYFILVTLIIKFLNCTDYQPAKDLPDFFVTNPFLLYILLSTRITSYSKILIDNIFSNFILREIISGKMTDHLHNWSPDHLP